MYKVWSSIWGIVLFASLLWGAASAPYSYSYIPKHLYPKQIFPVTVLVNNFNPKNPPRFEYDTLSLLQPLNEEPLRVLNGKDAFYTFYFKVPENNKSESIKLPNLSIWNLTLSYTLQGKSIPISRLDSSGIENYCGVIASDFKIRGVEINPYDSKNSLISLKIEAHEANLEDMHIPDILDDGIEKLIRKHALVSANYFFIIPNTKKEIRFNYYNIIKHSFVPVKVNTDYQQAPFVTETVLSPKESSFEKLKRYVVIALTILFLILYISTREYLYLLMVIISAVAMIILYIPHSKICISEGAPLYILPTQSSTVSTQVNKEIIRPVYHNYRNYYKIEYKPGITGWIKDEDLCKD